MEEAECSSSDQVTSSGIPRKYTYFNFKLKACIKM